uniref:Uncharacterized protein LOC102807643 n=1 Tax=Saccoglossus kowalevskii TaxID=10224 RepID=A0ABM0MZR1_SACKO|nr:PREDICTED: uncharacterized protein LOC102807643 [Saccoglossus kowalevskii]
MGLESIFRTVSLRGLLLVNLAISDLLVGVLAMPFSLISLITGRWLLGSALCEITGFLALLFSVSSTLTVACISIDRYCAVVHPLDYLNMMTPIRAKYMVSIIWICPGICSLMPLVGFGEYHYQSQELGCGVNWSGNLPFSLIVFVVAYAIPLLVMVYCYYHMVRAARSQARRIDAMPQVDGQRRRPALIRSERTKAVKILCLVIGFFILCWTPYSLLHLLQIVMVLDKNTIRKYMVLSKYLIYANSVVDPYIYTLLYRPFRRGLRNLLRQKCCFDSLRPKPSSAVIVSSRFLRRKEGCLRRIEASETDFNYELSSSDDGYGDPICDEDYDDGQDSDPLYLLYDDDNDCQQVFPNSHLTPQTLLHEAINKCQIETLSLNSSIGDISPKHSPQQRRQRKDSRVSRTFSTSSLLKKKVILSSLQETLPGEVADLDQCGYVISETRRKPKRRTLHHLLVDNYREPQRGRRGRASLQHEPNYMLSSSPKRKRVLKAIPVVIDSGDARYSRHHYSHPTVCSNLEVKTPRPPSSKISGRGECAGRPALLRRSSLTSTLSYNLEISDVIQMDITPPRARKYNTEDLSQRKISTMRRGIVSRLSEETEVDSDEAKHAVPLGLGDDEHDSVLKAGIKLTPERLRKSSNQNVDSEEQFNRFRLLPSAEEMIISDDEHGKRRTSTSQRLIGRPCLTRKESLIKLNSRRLERRSSRQRVSFSDQPFMTSPAMPGNRRRVESDRRSSGSESDCERRRESIRPTMIPPHERRRRKSVFKSPITSFEQK